MSKQMALVTNPVELGVLDRALGWAAVLAAGVLLHVVSLAQLSHALGRAKAFMCEREVTVDEALAAWSTVRGCRLTYPFRSACLEESLATTIVALLHRRDLSWCVGVRTSPFYAHSWVEVGGKPIGDSADLAECCRKIFSA
jgi:hypothetical protein